MTGIKEARVFFHRLLILGILLVLVSVYLGPWQGIASAQTVEEGSVSISVPSAPSTVDLVVLTAKTSSDVPGSAPTGYSWGTVFFELTQVDSDGAAVDSDSFSSPIKVDIAYSDADVAAAEGNPARLAAHRYDSSFGEWTELATTLDVTSGTLTTYVSDLGFFALIGEPQPPAPTPTATTAPKAAFVPYVATEKYGESTATPVPVPATATATATAVPVVPTATLLPPTPGDVSPGSNLLVGLFVLALIMISAGVYQLRHTAQD